MEENAAACLQAVMIAVASTAPSHGKQNKGKLSQIPAWAFISFGVKDLRCTLWDDGPESPRLQNLLCKLLMARLERRDNNVSGTP